MTLPLSILDLSLVDSGATASEALRNTIAIAQAADRLGYTRLWLAEHHNLASIASPAPEIMIGHVAAATTRLRVGSGGIMLPNHVPLKVVETFRVLEALHPGRIDLGIGRAPGTDTLTALALRRTREALGSEAFPSQLAELFAFANGDFPDDHPFKAIVATPSGVPLPPVWLLGSSDYSAQLAAALGLGFAFAHHIGAPNAVPAMRLYREGFSPSSALPEPYAIITASVTCADTAEEAEALARAQDLAWVRRARGQHGPVPSVADAAATPLTDAERAQARAGRVRFIGTPATVRAGIENLARQTEADEVMLTSSVPGHAARLRAVELLAEEFRLPGVATEPAGDLAAR